MAGSSLCECCKVVLHRLEGMACELSVCHGTKKWKKGGGGFKGLREKEQDAGC